MKELVEKLRSPTQKDHSEGAIYMQAADTIESLQVALAAETFKHDQMVKYYDQAQEEIAKLEREAVAYTITLENLQIDARRWAKFVGFTYGERMELVCNLSMAPVLTQYVQNGFYTKRGVGKAWNAWQASRHQALEEAAQALERCAKEPK